MNFFSRAMPVSMLLAIALFYIASGLQWVFIPWMAVSYFKLEPFAVGLLLALSLLPQILLLRYSGYLADRGRPVSLAIFACLGLAVCHSAFAMVFSQIELDKLWLDGLGLLAVYCLALGICTALFLPAKEKIVAQKMPNRLQRGLALGSAFQFAGVALGALSFGFTVFLPTGAIVAGAALACALSACLWWRQKALVQTDGGLSSGAKPVLRKTWPMFFRQTPVLPQLLQLVAFNGFMHLGFAIALFPIIGLTLWQFDAMQYGLMQAAFYGGCIVVFVSNAYRKPQQFPGQGALFCLLYTAVIAYGLTHSPTHAGRFSLIFLWGAIAGYSASMGRIVLHTVLADNERAQGVAFYQTALLAMAPVGSMVCGVLLQYLAIDQVLYIVAFASIALFLKFLFSKSLWAVEQACDPDQS